MTSGGLWPSPADYAPLGLCAPRNKAIGSPTGQIKAVVRSQLAWATQIVVATGALNSPTKCAGFSF